MPDAFLLQIIKFGSDVEKSSPHKRYVIPNHIGVNYSLVSCGGGGKFSHVAVLIYPLVTKNGLF